MKRTHLVFDMPEEQHYFHEGLSETFSDAFDRRGIALSMQRVDSQDSSDWDPVSLADSTEAQTLLVLSLTDTDHMNIGGTTHSMPTAGGGSTTITAPGSRRTYSLEVVLFDLEIERRVWRAKVTSTGGTPMSSQAQDAVVVADAIIDQLIKDGIIE